MAFFSILKLIGIGREELKHSDELDIIRIEKLLVAESKINTDLLNNDIQNTLDILSEYREQISLIALDEGLYNILSGSSYNYHYPTGMVFREGHRKKIALLTSRYFENEINLYIQTNVENDQWQGILALLDYKSFIPLSYFEIIRKKITSKIDYSLSFMESKPSHKELNKKVAFLKNQDFYDCMGRTYPDNGSLYIKKLLKFIEFNTGYTSGTKFFDLTLTAMRTYSRFDPALTQKLWGVYMSHGGRKSNVLIFWGILIGFIIALCMIVSYSLPERSEYPPRTNFWKGYQDSDILSKINYEREEKNIGWLNFIEARENPVTENNRLKTLKVTKPQKYDNPFIATFLSSYNTVLKPKERDSILYIFNNTEKECIALCYRYGKVPDVYALYVPPKDSISVTYSHYKIKFYAGNRLRAFNNYKKYVYSDSLDLKFTNFTRNDSILFKMDFEIRDTLQAKASRSIWLHQIRDIYQVKWNGQRELIDMDKTKRRPPNKEKSYTISF